MRRLNDDRLQITLKELSKFAKSGLNEGMTAVKLLKSTVNSVTHELEDDIFELRQSGFEERSTSTNLEEQLRVIKNNLSELPIKLEKDLKSLSTTFFSITLFGRTMAGKSTLMEVLTRGSGNSIGKGAQRTTRDVRKYFYKGMQITDVPGISAFKGAEDEEIAFEAAQKSDLILFLITDDAPQASEAEYLSRLIELGKPVIAIVNVKANISKDVNFKLFVRDIQKKMDIGRLNNIKQQFESFGEMYGQNWRTLKFANVHLKSAFLSQQTEWSEHQKELYQLSKFNYLENLIANEVASNGKYYKKKSFSDVVIVPIIEAAETLFEQSSQNSKQGTVLISKKRKLKNWINHYKNDSLSRIDSFIKNNSVELKREVASFAEDNYDNSSAEKSWQRVIERHNIQSKANDLLTHLSRESEDELKEIRREISAELKFSQLNFSDDSINMSKMINGKKIWNWASTLVSGGLTIAGLWFSPLVIAGIVVGVIGWLGSLLFGNRDNEIRDARRKLERKLDEHIDKILKPVKKQMLDIFYSELLKKQLYPTLDLIDNTISAMFDLSKTQQRLAKELNNKIIEMNTTVVNEALEYKGFNNIQVQKVARIPGVASLIVLIDGDEFPNNAKKELHFLLKEQVWFVFQTVNLKQMLIRSVGRGISRDSVSIEYIDDEPRIAHISEINIKNTNLLTRIRLAQQITALLIMK